MTSYPCGFNYGCYNFVCVCVCVCVCVYMFVWRGEDRPPFIDTATKYNPMFESDLTTGYSHYYQRYPEPPVHSSASAEASTDFSSEEIRHIYENSELTKEVWVCVHKYRVIYW